MLGIAKIALNLTESITGKSLSRRTVRAEHWQSCNVDSKVSNFDLRISESEMLLLLAESIY